MPFQTGGGSPEPSSRSGCLCIRLLPGDRGPWNSGMSAAAPAFQLVAGSVVPLPLAVTGTAHASFVHTEHAPPSEPGRPPVRHPTCLSAPLHCGRGQLRTSVCALAVLREAWGPSASWSPLPCPGPRCPVLGNELVIKSVPPQYLARSGSGNKRLSRAVYRGAFWARRTAWWTSPEPLTSRPSRSGARGQGPREPSPAAGPGSVSLCVSCICACVLDACNHMSMCLYFSVCLYF